VSRRNSDEPSSFEPGLDHLITALTTRGHPQELTGRDNALAAFRAASLPPFQFGAEAPPAATRSTRSVRSARRPRSRWQLIPVRLAAVTAAGFAAVFAGVTAAAYAQALPAQMQHIAHTVLAPLGVPNSQPQMRASGPASLPPSTAPAAASVGRQQPGASASPAAACPCPVTSTTTISRKAVTYAITLTAAKAQVRPDAFDEFTGKVSKAGQPAKDLRVRLLERVAGSPAWRVAATGVTGPKGEVKLRVRVPVSATFKLAVPDGRRSAPVAVTVGVPMTLKLSAGQPTDRLIVTAPAGAPGETVWLTVRKNGTWDNVTSLSLGPALRAAFTLPASTAGGHFYRARLADAGPGPHALSNALWVPKPHSGAKAIGGPTPSPSPSSSASGSPSPSATAPTGSPTSTAAPTPTVPAPSGQASSPAPASTAPTTPAPTTPAPTTPAPASTASASPAPTGTGPA
jgi:hypothetical protein